VGFNRKEGKMTLVEKLNLYGVRINGDCSWTAEPPDEAFNEQDEVVGEAAAFLVSLDSAVRRFDSHPGDNRCGKVATVELAGEESWFDEHSECRWV
jgi:hypothetical protein